MSDSGLIIAELSGYGVPADLLDRVARAMRPAARNASEEHARFAEFWSVYPKRSGTNSRKDASARFSAAVNRGVDPCVIIAGASRYFDYCNATGKIKTGFVRQAATWLNAENWDDVYTIPRAPASRFDLIADDLRRGGGAHADQPAALGHGNGEDSTRDRRVECEIGFFDR